MTRSRALVLRSSCGGVYPHVPGPHGFRRFWPFPRFGSPQGRSRTGTVEPPFDRARPATEAFQRSLRCQGPHSENTRWWWLVVVERRFEPPRLAGDLQDRSFGRSGILPWCAPEDANQRPLPHPRLRPTIPPMPASGARPRRPPVGALRTDRSAASRRIRSFLLLPARREYAAQAQRSSASCGLNLEAARSAGGRRARGRAVDAAGRPRISAGDRRAVERESHRTSRTAPRPARPIRNSRRGRRPRGDHRYLGVLGTDPDHRRPAARPSWNPARAGRHGRYSRPTWTPARPRTVLYERFGSGLREPPSRADPLLGSGPGPAATA